MSKLSNGLSDPEKALESYKKSLTPRTDALIAELRDALQGLYEHTKNNHNICGLNEAARAAISKATGA